MFVNCPHCRALVATDPATDLPPPTCPDCGGPLRDQTAGATASGIAVSTAGVDAVSAHAAAMSSQDAPAPHRDSWWDEAEARSHTDDGEDRDDTSADRTQVADALDPPASIRDDADVHADTALTAAEAPSLAEATAPAVGPISAARPASATAPSRGSLPGFLRRRERTGARSDWRAPAAIIGLSLLLGLQLLLADRARLAGQAGWRPLLSALCAGLRCELPPWREPAAFTLLQRDVRQHPTLPGALRVSASFRNDARWPQPWPRLQVALADANGRTAGIRSFEAAEYLGGAPAQAELSSGETATLAMDILEPAPDIVSFDFSFH